MPVADGSFYFYAILSIRDKMKKIILQLCLPFLMMSSFIACNTSGNNFDDIMKGIYLDDSPGVALIVLQSDKPAYVKAFGLANLEPGEKVTADTHFRMASVSKQFTAMCVLRLQKEGELDVMEPASKYLPELPGFAKSITIQQLMDHTSGIADYEGLIPKDQTTQVTDAQVLQLISQSDSLYFQPGTKFQYSNTAFCLLTQIVERVSGMSYPDFIKENIFTPLDMPDSRIYKKDAVIAHRAYGYTNDDGKWRFADQSRTSATMGDGSVYTSVNEYRHWIKYLWNLKPVNDTVNPMKPHSHVKTGLDYGYGWFIATETDGSTGFFHSGESTGFHNIVYHNPSKKLLLAMFTNADDDRVSGIFEVLMQTFNVKLRDVPRGETLFHFLSKIYGD